MSHRTAKKPGGNSRGNMESEWVKEGTIPGKTDPEKEQEVRKVVRQASSCCGPASVYCGGQAVADDTGRRIGYSDEEMREAPEGANLGLGCGNPVTLAGVEEGEIVVDLGSGAGFDSFPAARRVGESGRVIGVDMTPEMMRGRGPTRPPPGTRTSNSGRER